MTDWLILLFIVAIALSDLLLIWQHLPPYSRRLRIIGRHVSFFPYAWGVLGGHFWGPVPALTHTHTWWVQLALLLAFGGAFTLVHLALRKAWPWASGLLPLLAYLPLGVVIGMLVWSQA